MDHVGFIIFAAFSMNMIHWNLLRRPILGLEYTHDLTLLRSISDKLSLYNEHIPVYSDFCSPGQLTRCS